MAARTRKIRHDDETRAYVYKIVDEAGVLYVGKGTGRRFAVQKQRYAADGEIVEYCKSETEAFRRERELIAELSPPLNKCPGGNGGRRRRKRVTKYERELNKLDSQKYAAQVLMGVYRVAPHMIDASALPGILKHFQLHSE